MYGYSIGGVDSKGFAYELDVRKGLRSCDALISRLDADLLERKGNVRQIIFDIRGAHVSLTGAALYALHDAWEIGNLSKAVFKIVENRL